MIVLIRGDEIAFVLKTMGEDKFGFINYSKRDLSEAGKLYRENNLHRVGVLIDCGVSEDGEHELRILSKDTFDIEAE